MNQSVLPEALAREAIHYTFELLARGTLAGGAIMVQVRDRMFRDNPDGWETFKPTMMDAMVVFAQSGYGTIVDIPPDPDPEPPTPPTPPVVVPVVKQKKLSSLELTDDDRENLDMLCRDLVRYWPCGVISLVEMRKILQTNINSQILGSALSDAGGVRYGPVRLPRGAGTTQIYSLHSFAPLTDKAISTEIRALPFALKLTKFYQNVATANAPPAELEAGK